MDTIVAISTPIGAGAIGIIRLSGGQCLTLALRFFISSKYKTESDVVPNYLQLGHFKSGEIDERCMMVYFRAPKSYTGEDMVEFQVHGGALVTKSILEVLLQAGARLAEPGEFTKRAFLAGKVSLDKAEGIAAVINAQSSAELRSAYSLANGRFDATLADMTEHLTNVLSTMEASLDYPEEMADEVDDSLEEAKKVREKMRALIDSVNAGKMIRDGITIAILGKTNVGKSSLLNSILGFSRAIVTEIHGTTRDIIEQSFVYKGIKLNFQDTAGIRETQDRVEAIGIGRSLDAGKSADVVLYLLEAGKKPDDEEYDVINSLGDKVIFVCNKVDILGKVGEGVYISAKTGEGVKDLLDKIIAKIALETHNNDVLIEERHVDCVRRALASLNSALASFDKIEKECVLVDLRESISALAEISGGGATERIIDDVFSRFCVGK